MGILYSSHVCYLELNLIKHRYIYENFSYICTTHSEALNS